MATAAATTTSYDLTKADAGLVVRALETQVSVVTRQIRAEPDPDIKALRQVQVDALQSLIARFR
nr:MAG: hypothetical protein [Microvirus sp.]DAM31249.1 MAG TPA: hypothetical protein [Microviridae sp.]